MRLNEIDGHYNPSFFNMVLETNEDISGAINKYTATFVHEFIHYIQDIILPYNIRMNLSKLRWFSNMRQSALSNGYIIRPFNDWYSDSKTTLLQYNMTMGEYLVIQDLLTEHGNWKMQFRFLKKHLVLTLRIQ